MLKTVDNRSLRFTLGKYFTDGRKKFQISKREWATVIVIQILTVDMWGINQNEPVLTLHKRIKFIKKTDSADLGLIQSIWYRHFNLERRIIDKRSNTLGSFFQFFDKRPVSFASNCLITSCSLCRASSWRKQADDSRGM